MFPLSSGGVSTVKKALVDTSNSPMYLSATTDQEGSDFVDEWLK